MQILLSLLFLYLMNFEIELDDGCKGDRKLVGLTRKDIEKDLVDALVGFYTFTKYDYVSSFAEEKKSVGEKS